ncbi:MAG: alpha-2-macroglobulin family protein [Prosthecobacter sp.]|uniref:alpha-2-macroglobulin family protein n=1 Tax=Prosthecobacter sp. TaxID=1965333 RepID=UPI003903A351
MKNTPLLVVLVLLLACRVQAASEWWMQDAALPADIQQLIKSNQREGIPALARAHLGKMQAWSDQAVVKLFYWLISDPQTDVERLLKDFRPHLIERPAVGLEVALMLVHNDVYIGHMRDDRFVRGNNFSGESPPASAYEKNRWHALKLVLAVRNTLTANADMKLRAQMLETLAQLLCSRFLNDEHWSLYPNTGLLRLTDLNTEPAIMQSQGGSSWPSPGVGDDPTVWFLITPATFEAAKSDGERWRWALAQLDALGGRHRTTASMLTARVMAGVFTARVLPGLSGESPIVGQQPVPEKPELALHTLDDNETVIIVGGSLRRLRLPPDFSFMAHLKTAALDEGLDEATRESITTLLAMEWSARWQHDRTLAFLRQLPRNQAKKAAASEGPSWIESPQLSFSSSGPQVAGTPAKLRVMSRNVTRVKFTAQAVDMRKIITDIERHMRQSEKQQEGKKDEWKWRAIEGLHMRLTGKDAAQWLMGKPVRWTAKITPAPHHWDQVNEITAPLSNAGVWLITCDAGTKKPDQTLLWLDELVVLKIPQLLPVPPPPGPAAPSSSPAPALGSDPFGPPPVPGEKPATVPKVEIVVPAMTRDPFGGAWQEPRRLTRYLILEAATGRPVPGARLIISGGRPWRSEPEAKDVPFIRIEHQADEHGSLVIAEADLPDSHHWLFRVEDTHGRLHVLGEDYRRYTGYDPAMNDMLPDSPGSARQFSIIDQPAYHPGQEVRWKTWLRHRNAALQDETVRKAGGVTNVALHQGEPYESNSPLGKQTVALDAGGAAHGTLRLPDGGILGAHHLSIDSQIEVFPVEEFRKPEFLAEASVKSPSVAAGGKFEFQINARYYSGAPLIGGRVRYHIKRFALGGASPKPACPATEWDWLYGNGHAWPEAYWKEGTGWGDSQGTEMTSGAIPLRADGTAHIPVDTLGTMLTSGNAAVKYTLDAWVIDDTQRVTALIASHIVTAQPCTLILDTDHGFYHAGARSRLTLRSFNTDGSPAPVTATLRHTAPDGAVSSLAFPAMTGGQCDLALDLPQFGLHRLQVDAVLPDGQTTSTRRDIAVLDEGKSLNVPADTAALDLQLRNREHAPGEDAELLITSRHADADVWLFIRVKNGVYPDPVHVRLQGHHAVHRMAVSAKDQPNFFVQAATVADGRVFNVSRQVFVPPKQFIASVRMETDRPNYHPGDKCRVKIITARHDGSPLQANVAFTAYDKTLDALAHQSGRYYPEQPDIRKFFWGWKRLHRQLITDTAEQNGLVDYDFPGMVSSNWDEYYPWCQEDDRAGAFADVGSDPSSIPPAGTAVAAMPASFANLLKQTRVRQNQRDSIAWEPDLRTDERGEAIVEFTLPDNLTTWSLKAWAVGPKTEVGQAAHDLRVSKPLELRIAAPRFLIAGDEAALTASIVHAEQKNRPLQAVIEWQGDAATLLDAPAQNTTLDTNGGAQLTWHVKAAHEGTCTIRIKVACDNASDATEITLPVRLAHTAQLESWDISVAPEQSERVLEFIVPANDRPDSTRLEVRLTPSVLAVIVDALPYLAEYPHGCAEQTLNRFLPTLIAHRTVAALKLDMKALHQAALEAGAKRTIMKLPEHLQRWQRDEQLPRWNQASLFDAEKVQVMASVGLQRLASMAVRDQHGDGSAGGWAWFGGSVRSNAQLTALIVHGFLQARLSGLQVDNNALTAGFTALQKHEEKQLRCVTDPAYYGLKEKHLGNDLDVLVHATLVESLEPPSKSNDTDKLQSLRDNDSFRKAQPAASMRRHLIEGRDHLASISLARLAMACHQLGENSDRDLLLRLLKDKVKIDAATRLAWIDTSSNGTWQQDFIETQAAFLRLLLLVEPASTLTADVARNLITRRSQGRFWNSTRDTAASIEALAAYALATGEMEKHQTVQVLLDGKQRHQLELQRDSTLAAVPNMVFDASDLAVGKHTLTLRLAGGGSLSATAGLQHFGPPVAAPVSALKLTRRLWRVDPASVQAAQTSYQSYGWSQHEIRRELVTEDTPLKPGDMIELECRFESGQPLEYLLLESPLPAALHPVHSLSGWERQDDLYGYQEVRDDRVCSFMEHLNHGTHILRILTRVENSGSFMLPPASITAMYSPSFHATSGSQVMHVK